MSDASVSAWLPWKTFGYQNDDALRFRWFCIVNDIVALLAQERLRIPVFIDGQGMVLNWYLQALPEAKSQIRQLAARGLLYTGCWHTRLRDVSFGGEGLVRNRILYSTTGPFSAKHGAAAAANGHDESNHKCWALLPGNMPYTEEMSRLLQGLGCAFTLAIVQEKTPVCNGNQHRCRHLLLDLTIPADLEQALQLSAAGAGPFPPLTVHAAPLTLPGSPHLAEQRRRPAPLLACCSPAAAQLAANFGNDGLWHGLLQPLAAAYLNLTAWAEPLAAAAWARGNQYPAEFLKRAWEHYLLSQADPDTRSALARSAAAAELATVIARQCLAHAAAGTANATAAQCGPDASGLGPTETILVYNPLCCRRSEVITCQCTLPSGAPHFQLVNAAGESVPYQQHNSAPPTADQSATEQRIAISFRAEDLPAAGFRRYHIVPSRHKPYYLGESIAAGNVLENKHLRVLVIKPNGALRLEDKRTGVIYDNCNVFEDCGDAGTPAMYQPVEQDRVITTYAVHAAQTIVENGMYLGAIQVRHTLALPEGLQAAPTRRSDRWVDCEILTQVTLRHNAAYVEIRTEVVNRARDHRLRVLFSTGLAAAACRVGTPFAVAELSGSRRLQTVRQRTHPFANLLDISNGTHGLAIAMQGWSEFEEKPTPAGTIAVTLLRAVRAGQTDADATQLLTSLSFDYALIPHAGGWEQALPDALAFCRPCFVCHGSQLGGLRRQIGNIGNAEHKPLISGLVQIHPVNIVASAVKRSEDGKCLVIRAVNVSDAPVTARITLGFPVSDAYKADLLETPQTALPVADRHALSVPFAPKEIVTLLLHPQAGEQ